MHVVKDEVQNSGVAMSADASVELLKYRTAYINAITEDHDGHYWLGLNSGGIFKVDPGDDEVEGRCLTSRIGVLNDVVVRS